MAGVSGPITGLESSLIGLVGGVGALGGLVGGPVALGLGRRWGDGRALMCFAAMCAPCYALAVVPMWDGLRLPAVMIGVTVVAGCLVGYNVVQRTIRQPAAEDDSLARVSASMRWISAVAAPAGAATAGAAAETLGVRPALVIGVGGLLLPYVVLGFSPLWGWSSIPDPEKNAVTVPRGHRPAAGGGVLG